MTLVANLTTIAQTLKHAETAIASTLALKEILVHELLNALLKITEPLARARLVSLVIHLSTAIRNRFRKLSVLTILTARLTLLASTRSVKTRVPKEIHALKMLNAEFLTTDLCAIVHQVGAVILKELATNVRNDFKFYRHQT